MASLLLAGGAAGGLFSTLATVATVAAPVLGVASAMQGIKEGKEQEGELKRQATEERLMSNVQAERVRRDSRQRQSAERTAMIEGGAFSGTAQGVLDQNAVAQELEALDVSFRGEQQGRAAEFAAEQSKGSPLNVFGAAIEGFNQMDSLNIGN